MSENKAFTDRCIAALQHMSIEEPKALAMTHYLMRQGRLAWDDERSLFWVRPTNAQPQVAVWMMPAILMAEAA